MATKKISDYTAATGIDASADYLLIDPSSSGVYKKINRNTFLSLASVPLGLTDTQSPTNKTFDNTNSITVKDGSLTIQNSSSTTKQAVFSASGITAGQTRTFTFPDASGTLVTAAGTQTLTNKTITSPTITGGSIDNSTITVDSISGHTTSTVVTVGNLQISNGVLNTANSVTATAIAAGAVQPQALVSGTGSGWAWQTWSPTWSNLTVGNGVLGTAKYIQIGKTVIGELQLTLGTTSSVSGNITFTLPVTANSRYTGNRYEFGTARLFHSGGSDYPASVENADTTTTAFINTWNASGTYTIFSGTSSTIPFTWAANDTLSARFTYEAA